MAKKAPAAVNPDAEAGGSTGFAVEEPIQNSAFAEPTKYWYLREGETPDLREGRRPAIVYPPRLQLFPWDLKDGALRPAEDYPGAYELTLVNLVRSRLAAWRAQGYPGVSRTTLELLNYWRREERAQRLFFAQVEAVESIIFLSEGRSDLRQGLAIPMDEPTATQLAEGAKAFRRYACKMATGSGKTTVMAMVIAWSVLNKVNNHSDGRFSDTVLAVCPNVTIRNQLLKLNPNEGEASLYRTRDLVPAHLMPLLAQGRVMVTNWHLFERQQMQIGGVSARVSKVGVAVKTTETIHIGAKNTTARGSRYLTEDELQRQIDFGMVKVVDEIRDSQGNLKKVKVDATRYMESDSRWIERVLGREVGGKQNLLILNDEAHHAYRIRADEPDEPDLFADEEDFEEEDEVIREATVWVEGLDRINRMRGINFCVDLSATPFFLVKVGRDANRPFPWVVSDFGLIDAIESGLVKIPQLAVRDPSGSEVAKYFNIWEWITKQMTPAERGAKKVSPKPEAILKYAHHPMTILGEEWEKTRQEWEKNPDEPRTPVLIVVCKNTKIAKVVHEWLADGVCPAGIPKSSLTSLRNTNGEKMTIRVDTKIVHETDSGEAKSDETRWMRLTLDTVGKLDWPRDRQERTLFPEGFEDLAKKLEKPLHPPGRDVRCIVSVGMLTEGWDCNTVTHIIGLRPFMSQLLCEQVVGRGLRRASYTPDPDRDDKFTEEIAMVLGVPFEVIPFKAVVRVPVGQKERRHVHALPNKTNFRIRFPRVEGYLQAIRSRVTVNWESEAPVRLDPLNIPPEVEMKAGLPNNLGRPALTGPGKLERYDLNPYRSGRRFQELVYELAGALTRDYAAVESCAVPAHALFPQLVRIVERFLQEKVIVQHPADIRDVFLSPYYGWVIERLRDAIRPDTSEGESPELPRHERMRGPGSTDEVDFWTSKPVREVLKSHLNYVVADTQVWEQSAAYFIDGHPATVSFVKNAGLGFAIPYFHNGQPHEYLPDFIIRLAGNGERYLILETKGYDPLEEIKTTAAKRWVAAVNADKKFGAWDYVVVKRPEAVIEELNKKS